MASTIILSDNGASSGSAGLKTTGGNDGKLILQTATSGGTATDAVTIDTSQNVGIGTSSPAQKLDVQAADYVAIRAFSDNSDVDTRLQSYSTNGTGYVGTISNHPFFVCTNNTERMRIDASGNVGIGTSSPNYKLQVKAATNQNFTVGGAVNVANSVSLAAVNDANNANIPVEMRYATNFAWIDSGTERMRIDSSGNVGIGTSSPYGKLDVYSGTDRHLGFAAAATLSTGSKIESLNNAGTANVGLEIRASDCVWYNTGTELMRLASTGIVTGTAGNLMLVSGTSVNTTSGTLVDFTGIPTWAKKITVVFNNVSLAASNDVWVRLGTAGTGIYTSGYKCGAGSSAGTGYTSDVAIACTSGLTSAQFVSGSLTMYNVSGNIWSGNFQVTRYSSNGYQGAFGITLDGAITTVRVMDSAGGTFDSGVVNIFYE